MSLPVTNVIEPRPRDLGDFVVRRVLPSGRQPTVGPFVFFDHMGPADFPPGKGIDVRPHPHINLATVTYLFEGSLMHRDSVGATQNIEPGAVNWMTAGRGIVHSERSNDAFRQQQSRIHGIQSWVALPVTEEECEPSFKHYPSDRLPETTIGTVAVRLIAGQAFGLSSPVPFSHPIAYADCEAELGGELTIDPEYSERAIYVVEGAVNITGTRYEPGQMILLSAGEAVTIGLSDASRMMYLAGEPFPETRHIWWNFVSSRLERIQQAKHDWREGKFDAVPGEDEFIPLPE
ncbi:MAG: pirin family protein [Pseudomonadota bacterium]